MSNHPSGFTGWTHVGSDARIEVGHGEGGVEDVRVSFRTPASMFTVPDLYLAQDKARELRDALSQVLTEIDFAVRAEDVESSRQFYGSLGVSGANLARAPWVADGNVVLAGGE